MPLATKLFVLMAMLFSGTGTPFLKMSQRQGINFSEVLMVNGFTCIILSLITHFILNLPYNFGFSGMRFLVPGLFILNIAFSLTNYLYGLQGGYVSIISSMGILSVLITVFISLTLLGEAKHIDLPRLILGIMGAFPVVYLITSAIKTN